MTREELMSLKRGDIVVNLGSGGSYIVEIEPTPITWAIGIRSIFISNPSEWEKVKK
jgi:hypothetical protein